VDATRHDTAKEEVLERECEERPVPKIIRINRNEKAMLRSFQGHEIPFQIRHRATMHWAFPRKSPPEFPNRVTAILIPQGLHAIQHLLIRLRMYLPRLVSTQIKEINHGASGGAVENISRGDIPTQH
jgi:hypothetical protein